MTFELQEPLPQTVQRYYSDLAMLGRHYVVLNTLFPDKKRQYTICNCMEKTVYSEYIKVIETFKAVMRIGQQGSSPYRKAQTKKVVSQKDERAGVIVTGKVLNLNMDKIKFHKEFLDEKPSNVLTRVVKNYMTRDGLSRRIAQDE
jgi:hypothetical protein